MTYDELKNGLKSLFSTLGAKTSDSNYGVALLDKTSGEPKGLMGMSALASVLGEYSEKTISVAGKNSVSFNANSCAMLIWCVRGVSFMVGVATIENTNIRTIREGYGTLTYSSPNATLTFESTPGVGCVLHYTLIGFKN